MTETENPDTAPVDLPDGSYAIVELMGHQKMVGRVEEVEEFGIKMLKVEALFNGMLLDPVLQHPQALYRISPCSAQVAWDRQPRQAYYLPDALRARLTPAQLPPPSPTPTDYEDADYDDNYDDGIPI